MPTVRPIDANALIKDITEKGWLKYDITKDPVEVTAISSAIDAALTLDYEPVVHAHWERHYTFTDRHNKKHYWGYHCSSCGKGWIEAQFEKHYYCYCCGAKMDEEQQ